MLVAPVLCVAHASVPRGQRWQRLHGWLVASIENWSVLVAVKSTVGAIVGATPRGRPPMMDTGFTAGAAFGAVGRASQTLRYLWRLMLH
jgi:hypothetical protein